MSAEAQPNHAEQADAVVVGGSPLSGTSASTAAAGSNNNKELTIILAENGYASPWSDRYFCAVPGGGTFGLLDTGAVLWPAARTLARLVECPRCGVAQAEQAYLKRQRHHHHQPPQPQPQRQDAETASSERSHPVDGLATRREAAPSGGGGAMAGSCKRPFGVLELGAGFGLPAIVAAASTRSAKVGITDVDTPAAMQRARDSIARNATSEEAGRTTAFPLDWGAAPFPDLGWVDVHIAADVLYEQTWELYTQLASTLLRARSHGGTHGGPDRSAAPEMWMVNTLRALVHRWHRKMSSKFEIVTLGCEECISISRGKGVVGVGSAAAAATASSEVAWKIRLKHDQPAAKDPEAAAGEGSPV